MSRLITVVTCRTRFPSQGACDQGTVTSSPEYRGSSSYNTGCPRNTGEARPTTLDVPGIPGKLVLQHWMCDMTLEVEEA